MSAQEILQTGGAEMIEATIDSMTLVANDLDAMASYYTGVFGIDFETHEIEGGSLKAGDWGDIHFVLVPQEISQCDAKDNRMHFDIHVPDIQEFIAAVEAHGGRTNGNLADTPEMLVIGVYDPDNNFMVAQQIKA
jgi:predicted enzyme related to lactoylglutathione lyase